MSSLLAPSGMIDATGQKRGLRIRWTDPRARPHQAELYYKKCGHFCGSYDTRLFKYCCECSFVRKGGAVVVLTDNWCLICMGGARV